MIDAREITPELLARICVLVFTEIPINKVIKDKILFDDITDDILADLMIHNDYFLKSYSRLECQSYAKSIIDHVNQKKKWYSERHASQMLGQRGLSPHAINVFDLLMVTIRDILIEDNGQIIFNYDEIIPWRYLSGHLGEELLLSSKYADLDYRYGYGKRTWFAWPYVTKHNNHQLNVIIQQGIADNHFHLWPSTPYFHASWINLMNQIADEQVVDDLRKLPAIEGISELEIEHWSPTAAYMHLLDKEDEISDERAWEILQLQAAWIRILLCERLSGIFPLAEYQAPNRGNGSRVSQVFFNLQELLMPCNRYMLLTTKADLQNEIDSYVNVNKNGVISGYYEDYAHAMGKLSLTERESPFGILIGERWLYHGVMFDYLKPVNSRALLLSDYKLFFIYLLIRMRFRTKSVQCNDLMGFDNFQRIEKRKSYFLESGAFNKQLIGLAVGNEIEKSYVQALEIRIAIDQRQGLEKQLQYLIRLISPNRNEMPSTCQFDFKEKKSAYLRRFQTESCADSIIARSKYCFVVLFLKRNDLLSEKLDHRDITYRHEPMRAMLQRQANEIIFLREKNPHLAQKLRGIDAASQEIGCRPEVFAGTYRQLGKHSFEYSVDIDKRERLPALKKTFHVGEDFLDIVDGLRAIDEVIRFLNFSHGDRIGHAIVLGIDVENWYQKKNHMISLAVQDYLDNLAWLYHALTHYSISIPNIGGLKERINSDFEYWFRLVYRNHMHEDCLQSIVQKAQNYYDENPSEGSHLYHVHTFHFDIMDYYRAWSLRGDDPSCYCEGFFKKPNGPIANLLRERCKINDSFPIHYEERYVAEYSILNYYYQFDGNVRREGAKEINVRISKEYILGVKAVQAQMRVLLARKGVSIECNPTSNVLISGFRSYDMHPIFQLYNRGLCAENCENSECEQLNVSINTDDRGVFYTDLEMEYALLANAFEKMDDNAGNRRFKKSDVYRWIDNIRKMGLNQSFLNGDDGQE